LLDSSQGIVKEDSLHKVSSTQSHGKAKAALS